MNPIKTSRHNIIALVAGASLAIASATAFAAKGGNGGGGGGKPGPTDGDPVYTADSFDLGIASIDSYSVDEVTTVRWRQSSLDYTDFVGSFPNGDSCNHGQVTGSFSIYPADAGNPYTAIFKSYFQSTLDNNNTATHVMTMEGSFDDPNNWPPAAGTPTSVTFNDWAIQAENRKAQRNDCAGEAADLSGSWTIYVELKQ